MFCMFLLVRLSIHHSLSYLLQSKEGKRINKLFNRYRTMSLPAKATLWFFIGNIFQKGIAFISTPIFTRLMSTNDFGAYNFYLSWLSIFTVLLTLRLDYGGFNKGLTKYKDDKDGFAFSR